MAFGNKLGKKIGAAYVHIGANLSPLRKQLRQAKVIFMKSMKSLARIARRAALAVGAGLAAGLIWATKAAIEQEQAEKKVATALRATAYAAGLTEKQLKKHAAALEEVTTFGDEAILAMQALLLTFKQVKGDTFKRATEAILDMSFAMDKGLQRTALQVGKALNDPILGITALRISGVQLTTEQDKMVKSFVAVNNIAGAQNIILGELESQFGGMSRITDSTSGKLAQLKNTIGTVAEGIGGALLPKINELAIRLTDWLKANDSFIKQKFESFLDRVTDSIENYGGAVGKVLKPTAELVGSIAGIILKFPKTAGTIIATAITFKTLGISVVGLVTALGTLGGPLIIALAGIGALVTVIVKLKKAANELSDAVEDYRKWDDPKFVAEFKRAARERVKARNKEIETVKKQQAEEEKLLKLQKRGAVKQASEAATQKIDDERNARRKLLQDRVSWLSKIQGMETTAAQQVLKDKKELRALEAEDFNTTFQRAKKAREIQRGLLSDRIAKLSKTPGTESEIAKSLDDNRIAGLKEVKDLEEAMAKAREELFRMEADDLAKALDGKMTGEAIYQLQKIKRERAAAKQTKESRIRTAIEIYSKLDGFEEELHSLRLKLLREQAKEYAKFLDGKLTRQEVYEKLVAAMEKEQGKKSKREQLEETASMFSQLEGFEKQHMKARVALWKIQAKEFSKSGLVTEQEAFEALLARFKSTNEAPEIQTQTADAVSNGFSSLDQMWRTLSTTTTSQEQRMFDLTKEQLDQNKITNEKLDVIIEQSTENKGIGVQ